MTRNPSKPVKPSWAARVLCIDYADLPRLDRPWTKGDVRALRDAKPSWLTDARRQHADRVQRDREMRITRLVETLDRLGYDAPDFGTLDQAARYIDGALTHLMIETKCSEADAESAACRRWPGSMAEEEQDAEDIWRL